MTAATETTTEVFHTLKSLSAMADAELDAMAAKDAELALIAQQANRLNDERNAAAERAQQAEADLALIRQHYDRLKRSITAVCEDHATFSPGCSECRLSELSAQLLAARADGAVTALLIADLWEEIAPRIIELHDLQWRTPDEIRELARLESFRDLIAAPNPGAELLLELQSLRAALQQIQQMADEDLRLGNHPLETSLHQIEADARAALEEKR